MPVREGARLIDENQMLGIKIQPGVEPGVSPRSDVGPLLLADVRRFFDGNGMTIKKAPDRARGKACAMFLAQQFRQLNQRHVHLALDRSQNDIAISFNAMGPLIAALRLGTCDACPPAILSGRISL
jgi:hypothetical protein